MGAESDHFLFALLRFDSRNSGQLVPQLFPSLPDLACN